MKETRYFYTPDPLCGVLPAAESTHALRVLHLQVGDTLWLTNGTGTLYTAEVSNTDHKLCTYTILEALPQPRTWQGHIHLAVAPTKNIDRIEWLTEKATEIGWDQLTLLTCTYAQRKAVREDRLQKIMVAAMKQSHKATLPIVQGMTPFAQWLKGPLPTHRYIAHCYDPADLITSHAPLTDNPKPYLLDILQPHTDTVVAIGPEGDFSIDEVRTAIAHGFQPISLGESRLRTETAALTAVLMMQINNRV